MFMCGCPQGVDEQHFYFKLLQDKDLNTFNHFTIDDVEYPRFKTKAKTLILHKPTHDNIKNLAPGYVDNLEEIYIKGSNFYKQQLLGQPVVATSEDNLFKVTGKNIQSFDFNRTNFYYRIISLDFNVAKCSWLIAEVEGDVIKFLYDNKSRAMDTYEVCEQIKEKFPPNEYSNYEFLITGDASGSNKSTKSNKTDYDIIFKELGSHYKLLKSVPRSNPSVSNSIRNFNRLLLEGKIIFNREGCGELITCLNKAVASGDVLKKGNSDDVTHLIDAARYAVEIVHPSKTKLYSGSM